MHYQLKLPDDYAAYEGIMEAKGWVQASLELSDGRTYLVYFTTPLRLSQDAEEMFQRSSSLFFEPNLVLVPSVTTDSLRRACDELIAAGHIEDFTPSGRGT